MAPIDLISCLVSDELTRRSDRLLERRRKEAGFRDANKTLDKIVSAIKKDYASKTIFVDGHTDADPITRTKNTWEDNWDLSAARANAVRKYLTGHGVDSKKVNLRAFGPNHPKGSNKSASRRVEIVVQVG